MQLWNVVKSLPIVLSLVIGAASIPPNGAASNLAAWAQFFGLHDLPAWLVSPSADYQIPAYAVALSMFYAATVFGIPYWRKHRRETSPTDSFASVEEGKRPLLAPLVPQRDVWLLNALHYVAFGSWEVSEWYGQKEGEAERVLNAIYRASSDIRQAARDGTLSVWGREGRHSGTLELIPAEYWKYFKLSEYTLMKGLPEEFETEPENHRRHGFSVMRQLMTSKAQTEAIWGKHAAATDNSLRLSVGENEPYVKTKSRDFYGTDRTFFLKLENVHPSRAMRDCKITLLGIDPQQGYEGPWVISERLSLAAGDAQYVPLVKYGEAANPRRYDCSDSFMEILPAGAGRPKLAAYQTHTLSLRATSLDSAPSKARIKVWKDDHGRLRIEAIP